MYQSRIRNNKRGRQQKKRAFVEIEEGQQYAIVQDLLGNGRVNVVTEEGKVRMARIRGSMRKYTHKVIIDRGDLVLVALRDFGDDKVDLFHKYSTEDVSYLQRHGMLPEFILRKLQNGTDIGNMCDAAVREDYVVFMEKDEEGAASDAKEGGSSDGDPEETGSSSDEDELDIDAI